MSGLLFLCTYFFKLQFIIPHLDNTYYTKTLFVIYRFSFIRIICIAK